MSEEETKVSVLAEEAEEAVSSEEEKEHKEDAVADSAPAQSKKEAEEQEEEGEPIHRQDHVAFVSSIKASPYYAQVSNVLHWNDPVKSALLFGIGNFFFFLITYGEYSVITLLSYLALALIVVCGVYANGVMLIAHFKKQKVENPFQAKLKTPYVATKLSLEPHADSIIGLINDTIELSRSVLYFTDTFFSLKIAFFIWILSVLGKVFTGTTLLYASFLTSFVWPRIYQEKRVQIDHAYNLAFSKVTLYTNLVVDKLPFPKKKTA